MILRRARWRLTLGFTVVQLITYVLLAISVYGYVTTTFDFDGVEDGGTAITAEAGFAILRTALIVAFAALLVLAPVSSWVLASFAMKPVAATLAAQRRFVDDASHELRTPLTAIQAQLELALFRPRSSAEYQEACRRALEATHALSAISDDLIVASSDRNERTDADLVALADVAARARELLPNPTQVRLEVGSEPTVEASAVAVQRVLLNIMVNAVRYSPPDSPVAVRIVKRGRWGMIEVADQGRGMSRIEARRAFDRFWQADTSRGGEGSGLGLSIVQDIVTSLRGDVTITSAPGRGTTVRVRLPLSRSSHDVLRTVETTADSV